MSLCNCSLFLYYSQLLKERVEKKGCLELSSDQLIGLLCICVIVTCKWNFESWSGYLTAIMVGHSSVTAKEKRSGPWKPLTAKLV